ncbi:MAG: hypothetical protein Tsb0014_28530 [Pleurocapsa sp.]
MVFSIGVLILTGFPVTRSLAAPIISSQETTPPPNSEISSSSRPKNNSESTPVFGTKGFKSWYIHGALATTLDNEEAFPRRFGFVGGGLSKFFRDAHSVNLEFNTIYFDQPDDNAVGFNLALIGRWHLIRKANWSFYLDGGAGVMGTTNDVPRKGASFNFTPQVGAGTTINLAHQKQLMLGLRWHHISHAELFGSNPGRDSIMGYVGVNFPR